jgi:antitoxin (DNA-binding transcriptional repressor) of toxin-antitoxin stability system
MNKKVSVTEAARNFADCINRAHYQNVTFVLLRNGSPVARIVPDGDKHCSGRDLASAILGARLSSEEAREWNRDLVSARERLKPLADKWR